MTAPPSKYLPESIVDPRIVLRKSPIAGLGLFVWKPISQGEVVIRWGGTVFTEAQVCAGIARERSLGVIGESLYIGSAYDGPENKDEFLNHACDPNLWMFDAVTLVARRDLQPGEELLTDYALWETNESWSMVCQCKSPLCRRVISGDDWGDPILQERYQGHFSPYINTRIRGRQGTSASSHR